MLNRNQHAWIAMLVVAADLDDLGTVVRTRIGVVAAEQLADVFGSQLVRRNPLD